MKRILLFIGMLCAFNNLSAQKLITENTSSKKIEDVLIHVKFANNIIVKNWDKKEISIEATVNIDDNEHNDYFSFKTKNVGGHYTVTSDYGDYFMKYRSYYSYKNNHDNNDKKEGKEYHNHHHNNIVNYVIYVPKNMQLKVKSISGDIEVDKYYGIFQTDLISGNIIVKKHSKEMYLKTISGDIDIYISDATFTAKSLSGGIYSDLDINFEKKKRKGYGSKIHAKIKNGTASINLNTISGDIYLRKI